MMNCLKRSQRETRTPNLRSDSKEIGHTSCEVTTSGCSDILGTTRTKSSIMRQLGTSPTQRARNSTPRRYADLW